MKLLLALLVGAALGGCQKQSDGPQAKAPVSLTYGRIVQCEPTYDRSTPGQPARWRWLVELAPPLVLPGGPGPTTAYSLVKTFSLSVADTAVYHAGTAISFTYQAVPWSPPQWLSVYEMVSAQAMTPRYGNPELLLFEVRPL